MIPIWIQHSIVREAYRASHVHAEGRTLEKGSQEHGARKGLLRAQEGGGEGAKAEGEGTLLSPDAPCPDMNTGQEQ